MASAAIMTLNQDTRPAGERGKARDDGVLGERVTVEASPTGTTYDCEILSVAPTTLRPTLTRIGTRKWAFTPEGETLRGAQSYRIRLTVDAGTPTQAETTRVFSIKTQQTQLRIPAPGESADPGCTVATQDDIAVRDAADFNLSAWGAYDAVAEMIAGVDEIAEIGVLGLNNARTELAEQYSDFETSVQGMLTTESQTREVAIEGLSGRIDGNDTDIASLSSRISSNDSDISSLQSSVSSNDGELHRLMDRLRYVHFPPAEAQGTAWTYIFRAARFLPLTGRWSFDFYFISPSGCKFNIIAREPDETVSRNTVVTFGASYDIQHKATYLTVENTGVFDLWMSSLASNSTVRLLGGRGVLT